MSVFETEEYQNYKKVIDSHRRMDGEGIGHKNKYPSAEEREKLYTEEFFEQFKAASLWLAGVTKRKGVNHNHTSYGYKHMAERDQGRYISNAAIILAAYAGGFPVQADDHTNAFLGIAEKSLEKQSHPPRRYQISDLAEAMYKNEKSRRAAIQSDAYKFVDTVLCQEGYYVTAEGALGRKSGTPEIYFSEIIVCNSMRPKESKFEMPILRAMFSFWVKIQTDKHKEYSENV